jgi:hypothetical protein
VAKRIPFTKAERAAVEGAIERWEDYLPAERKALQSLLDKMDAALLPSAPGIAWPRVMEIAQAELGKVGVANPPVICARIKHLGLTEESLRRVCQLARQHIRPMYGGYSLTFVLSRAEALLAGGDSDEPASPEGGPNEL